MDFFIIFILGLEFGSFANVCIYRWPRNGSILRPRRSACPWCGKTLAWYDNIPVLSFIFLKGRCRQCRSAISWRYPIIELAMALLWTGLYAITKQTGFAEMVFLFSLLAFSFMLVVTTVTDLEWKIIPDEISLPMAGFALAMSPLNVLLEGPMALQHFIQAGVGCMAGAGIIFLISLLGRIVFKKEVMGGGDVKLMAAIGAYMGFQGALVTLFLGSLIGGIFSIAGLIMGRLKRHQYIPFGPFLNLGALIFLIAKLLGTDLWKKVSLLT